MAQVTEADAQVNAPQSLQSEQNAEKLDQPTEEVKKDAAPDLGLAASLAALNGQDDADGPGEGEELAYEGSGLDELTSLEQEIAKMHNIRPATASSEAGGDGSGAGGETENGSSGHAEDVPRQGSGTPLPAAGHEGAGNAANNESPLEEVDLIALLKGTDGESEKEREREKEKNKEKELDGGVTIEGEGQYEIMEIDDDDGAVSTSPKPHPTVTKFIPRPAAASARSSSYSSSRPKLSPEQARAVALEQMAGLKSKKQRRKETPPPSISPAMKPKDIVTSLNDDWDDYDSDEEFTPPAASPSPQAVVKKGPVIIKKMLPASAQSPSGSNNQLGSLKVMMKTVKPVAVEKPADSPPPKEELTTGAGFKRMRVIKRKIIWDPDAPETQKSFAQYASARATTSAATPKPATPKPAAPPKKPKVAVKNTATPPVAAKKEPAPKKPRAATPKNVVLAVKAEASARPSSPAKRRSQTPSLGLSNGVPQKKKKVSEIDRLMGDEGAANMIHAVEHEQRELSGGEVSNKPVMRKRAMTITGRNSRAVDPPVTPKKEPAQPATATKSSAKRAAANAVFDKANTSPANKPRPSDSWDYVYKQRASEESMIMRRRSNSSYSSSASVSRNSLDNRPGGSAALSDDAAEGTDPSFKFLKPVNKSNQRGMEPSSHTLANDLKANGGPLVTLKKVGKVGHLVVQTQSGRFGQTYTSQVLEKLSEALGIVARSSDYNVAVLTVQGQQFCQGIDYQELVRGSLEKRKKSTALLAEALKTYLCNLATFPKPLIMGIVGNLKNLGVMQLPLADFVVAADDCSFETHYDKLRQLPEGYALWHGHNKVSTQVHSRLILLGERLLASDVLGSNSFIDKTCAPGAVVEESLRIAKQISSSSAETYSTLKKLNHLASHAAKLPTLEEELKAIVEQWTSPDCAANLNRCLGDTDDYSS